MSAGKWLAAAQARADAATSSPWDVGGHSPTGPFVHVGSTPVGRKLGHGVATTWHERDATFIAAARSDLPVALAALRAVLDLHRPDGGIGGPGAMCVECTPAFATVMEDAVPWPCGTVRAIEAALTPPQADPGNRP